MDSNPPMRPSDLARLTALAAIWGGSFLFVRMAVGTLGAVWLTELRVGLAAVAMLIYAQTAGYKLDIAANWRTYLVVGGLNTALPWVMYAWAGHHISAAYMAILNAAAPWSAAVCGAIWLGERISRRKAAGLGLGMLGVGLLVGFGGTEVTTEVVVAALACIAATTCYALTGVYIKKKAATLSPRAMTVGSLVTASLLIAPFLPGPLPAGVFAVPVAIAVLGISLLCSAVAYLIYYRLMADVGPTRTLTVTFLIPVFGTFWGWLFLGEPVSLVTIVGGAAVIIATALVLEAKRA